MPQFKESQSIVMTFWFGIKPNRITNRINGIKSPLPNAKCQMPNAKCQMPNAKCQMPNMIYHYAQIFASSEIAFDKSQLCTGQAGYIYRKFTKWLGLQAILT
ncbi:hypothetical protein [Moraxella cuniculi]|uniref:hypothetical protein n=1 Tax=Moraxella cuniculi TaxID=34061 RepID=UPI000F838639|nr:hypothetical protein [Moraxella cuniculi]